METDEDRRDYLALPITPAATGERDHLYQYSPLTTDFSPIISSAKLLLKLLTNFEVCTNLNLTQVTMVACLAFGAEPLEGPGSVPFKNPETKAQASRMSKSDRDSERRRRKDMEGGRETTYTLGSGTAMRVTMITAKAMNTITGSTMANG